MHKASFTDFLLLFLLAGIWGSAFFNIKIASESYGFAKKALEQTRLV